MTVEINNRTKLIVNRAIYFLNEYLDNLDYNEIIEPKNVNGIICNESILNKNDFNIWKSYSWIEYSILQLRLKKNNLYDINSSKSNIKQKIKKNMNTIMIITILKERLKNIDYDDYETMIITLREVRDTLKIILKRTVFTRGKTYKPSLSNTK